MAGMREAGLPVELLEARHVRDPFKAMPVKTDRKDARGIALLPRLGWFRRVHCKSLPAQELRALLTARKLVQGKRHDIEMSLRGILRGFGDALLLARATLGEQLGKLQKRLVSLARDDMRARLLMTTPGIGVLVALTCVAAIDDPTRFRSSKATGAHFGLTPKKYKSGETDVTGRISKIGDASMRTALYEAANVILTRPVKGSSLKSWAMRVAKRAGMRKAKVALARKLAPDAGRRNRVRRRQGGCQSIDEGENHELGRTDTKRPEQVPSPGRWIRLDRKSGSSS
jgi:transposase